MATEVKDFHENGSEKEILDSNADDSGRKEEVGEELKDSNTSKNDSNKDPSNVTPSTGEIHIPNINKEIPGAIAGLLQACGTEMTQVEEELKELTGKQSEMYDKIREHNQMLESSLPLEELTKLFDNMKVGLDKLQSIRQEMFSIHERSAKLKERAAKLSALRKSANEANEDLIAVVNLDDQQPD